MGRRREPVGRSSTVGQNPGPARSITPRLRRPGFSGWPEMHTEQVNTFENENIKLEGWCEPLSRRV